MSSMKPDFCQKKNNRTLNQGAYLNGRILKRKIIVRAQDIDFILGTIVNAMERAFVITQRGRDYSLCSLITFASQLGFENLKWILLKSRKHPSSSKNMSSALAPCGQEKTILLSSRYKLLDPLFSFCDAGDSSSNRGHNKRVGIHPNITRGFGVLTVCVKPPNFFLILVPGVKKASFNLRLHQLAFCSHSEYLGTQFLLRMPIPSWSQSCNSRVSMCLIVWEKPFFISRALSLLDLHSGIDISWKIHYIR